MTDIDHLEEARTFAMGHSRTRELIVARKEDSDNDGLSFEFGEVPIHHPIPNDAQELVVNQLEKRIGQYQDGKRNLEEYRLPNVNREDPPLQYLPRDDFPMFDSIADLLKVVNFPDSSYKEPRPDFQVIRIRDSHGNCLLAFRQYTNHQFMSMDKKSWMFLQDHEYSKIDHESMISLPTKVDSIYFDGVFYVFKQKNFEDMFDWVEELENEVQNVVDTIEDSDVLVHNLADFRDGVFNHRMKMRKLYEVSQNGIVEDLDMDTAKDLIDEFDLNLGIEENGEGEEGVVIPNGNRVWDVIRLFNNDHLVSPVDDSRFQVFGKEKR